MKLRVATPPVRRRPKQRRARETVDAILDAVVKLLKREGSDAVTTNRIAEVAGVSIGSLYQYFPDKRAIFVALHNATSRRLIGWSRPPSSNMPDRRSTN